jgi:hypothetical protein
MKYILLTLILAFSFITVSAQEARIVRLDESREKVTSSEIRVLNFDDDRDVVSIKISETDIVSDTDLDGLSDYVEENIYFTDINKETTIEGTKTDMTKILLGLNPSVENSLEVKYEDIRLDSDASILKELSINDISFLEKKVLLKGKGLPNSITNIYLFNLGLVISLPTDSDGNWEYLLAKEIIDGRYDVYIGILNAEGTLVAKGEMVTFKQENGEVVINPGIDMTEFNLFTLFIKYFWWIMLSVFIFGTLVVGLLIWKNTEINKEMGDFDN